MTPHSTAGLLSSSHSKRDVHAHAHDYSNVCPKQGTVSTHKIK